MSGAYYNDNDQFMVEWLKHLIKRKVIADGEVDGRSIIEVKAEDLRGFTQCHFFAGIGTWSYALRRAGWPDELSVWTGSCPCPSFSASGERKGFSDPRHLWPSWGRIIAEYRPHVIFGEQVAKKDGRAWFDVVSSELEEIGYTIGAAALPACGFGAPHIRERIYFVAHSDLAIVPQIASTRHEQILRNDSDADAVADAASSRRTEGEDARANRKNEKENRRGSQESEQSGSNGAVAEPERRRRKQRHTKKRRVQIAGKRGATRKLGEPSSSRLERLTGNGEQREEPGRIVSPQERPAPEAGPTNGYWGDAVWIECSDGKLRPISPELSFFPVVDGLASGRVGLIRGAGNSIVAPVASAFIETVIEELRK